MVGFDIRRVVERTSPEHREPAASGMFYWDWSRPRLDCGNTPADAELSVDLTYASSDPANHGTSSLVFEEAHL